MHVARIVAVLAILVSRSPHAEPMSLRAALDHAHAHQPSLAAARARVAVARAAVDLPHAAFAPRITGAAEVLVGTTNNTTASYATLGIVDVARIGGTPANAPLSWKPEPSTFAGVALHQELFDFGRLETQADAQGAFARSAAETERAAELDLDLLVEESFYAVLAARQVHAASEAAVTRARVHRDLANAKVGAQLWPPVELARADADLARFDVDRVRAAGGVTIAEAVLAAAIGATTATVEAGADDVAFAALPVARAPGNAPELRAARAQLSAQQLATRAIRDELLPDVSLSAALSGRAGGAAVAANPTPTGGGWIPDVPNWDALVVVSWPLYDRTVLARASVSRRIEAVRAAELEQLTAQLRTALQRAGVELDVATAIELSDAEVLLTDAQIQLAIGQFQATRARARLARALAESP